MPSNFLLHPPMIRLWDKTTGRPEFVPPAIVWDYAKNMYVFQELDWVDHHTLPPTTAEDGTRYSHLVGYRLHCVLRFRIFHPNFAFTSGRGGTASGFTVDDLKRLDDARKKPQMLVEFLPHAVEENPPVLRPGNIVLVEKVSSGRVSNNWTQEIVLKFEGVSVVAERPEEL